MDSFQADSFDITGRKWNLRTCTGCGASFRHSYGKRLQPKEVNFSPCPHCGLIPLDALGASRAYFHGAMSIFSLGAGALGLIVVPILKIPYHEVAVYFVASALLIAAVHLAALLLRNNIRLAANLSRAQRLIRDGELALEKPGSCATPVGVPRLGWALPIRLVAVVLVLMAPVGAAAPEAMRLFHGWPLNPEFDPPVIGPGDTFRLTTDQGLWSINGQWAGTAMSTCLNADELGGPATFATESSTNGYWGDTMRVHKETKENTWAPLWADITVPSSETLEGKSVRLRVDIAASFPALVGPTTFQEATATTQREITVHLASLGASKTYSTLWWKGLLFGFAEAALGGALLKRSAMRLRRF